MAHIWKVTRCIKSKYGFYNKHVLSTYSKYGVYMDTKLKIDIDNVGITWLTDSPCNNHITFHFEIQRI